MPDSQFANRLSVVGLSAMPAAEVRVLGVRLVASLAVVAALVLPSATGGTNACMLDTGECTCEADDTSRCSGITPVFAAAGSTCSTPAMQKSETACHSGNIGMEYCQWCNTSRCLAIQNVPGRLNGAGICETNDCLLKGLHMLAACPEFWPNITGLGCQTFAAPSGECTADCAKHFMEYYDDVECQVWLDQAMLCDDVGRDNFLEGCQPKRSMRADANRFADECELLADSWVDFTWLIVLCIGAFLAVIGFVTMKMIRKQEKDNRFKGSNKVMGKNTQAKADSADMKEALAVDLE